MNLGLRWVLALTISGAFSIVGCDDTDPNESVDALSDQPGLDVDQLRARVAEATLPFDLHPAIVQPRNLYMGVGFPSEASCASADVDLDHDGRAGCDDPQCWHSPFADPTNICFKTEQVLALEEWSNEECFDGADNDGDGLVDCADDSCDCGPPLRDNDGLMIAVGALPRLVGVVFPAADVDGFDLAIGGVNTPWSRIHVTDLRVEDVGDVVAAGQSDGRLWMAFRERNPPERIHLYSWTDAGGVENHGDVPRPDGASESHPSFSRCPDLELLASPNELALFYRQSRADGESSVMVARGDGLSGDWDTTLVAASETGDAGRIEHTGCVTKAAFDSFGKLQALVMKQEFDPANPPHQGQYPTTIGGSALGYFEDANGAYRSRRIPDLVGYSRGGLGEREFDPTDPEYFGPVGGGWYGWDLGLDPRGYMISGPVLRHEITSPDWRVRVNPELTFHPNTLRYATQGLISAPNPLPGPGRYVTDALTNLGSPWDRIWGLEIQLDGGAIIPAYPDAPESGLRRLAGLALAGGGGDPAPVFNSSEDKHLYPEFARGPRPYDVGVCWNPDTARLVICLGGISEFTLDAFANPDPNAWPRPPEILESSVAKGAVDVEPDVGTIVVRLDTKGVPDNDIVVQLYESFLAPHEGQVQFSVDRPGGGVFNVTPSRPLEPNTPYLLAFEDPGTAGHGETTRHHLWLSSDFDPPRIRFRTRVEAAFSDPRDGERLDCDSDSLNWVRDADGHCHDTNRMPWSSTRVDLPLAFDVASAGNLQPWLVSPSGERVDGELVPHTNLNTPGWNALELSAPIVAPGGNCCGGACTSDGLCGVEGCLGQGAACGVDGECCSDRCDPTSGLCTRCRADDAVCVSDDECCTGRCTMGTCGVETCAAEGGGCTLDVDCCDGHCGGGLCFPAQCTINGRSCTDTSECCDGSVCVDVGSGQTLCLPRWENSQVGACRPSGELCTSGGGGVWEIHYPEGIENGVGAPVHDLDRVIRFEVEQAPLQLVATVPVDGATNVAIDAPIILTFDGPAVVSSNTVSVVDDATSTEVTLSLAQDSPSVWRLNHPPFAAATSYTLNLSSFIATPEGAPLIGAPIIIGFETAP